MKISTRKDKFLNEVLKLIHEKGFKAMTMRDIAEHMDFEVSNIYNFIDSKDSLLEIYLFDINDAFHSGIDNIIQSEYDPKEKLRAVVSLHIALTSSRPYEIALLVNEWRNLKDPHLKKFVKGRNDYEKKVKSILREGLDNGEFKAFDLDIMTHTVLSTVRWLYSWYIDHSEDFNPVELERQITTFIFEGVKA